MSRMFSSSFSNVSISAIQDVFEIAADSTAGVKIHYVEIGQVTALGDANAMEVPWQLIRAYTTSGSGGSTVTPRPLNPLSGTFAGTCEANNTTVATTGTPHTTHASVWNVQAPLIYMPTPQMIAGCQPSSRWVLRFPVAPASAIVCYGTCIFEVG